MQIFPGSKKVLKTVSRVIDNFMKNENVNPERRKFFKKAGIGAISAGLLSSIPFSLFSRPENSRKSGIEKNSVSITINPKAVKRENKK